MFLVHAVLQHLDGVDAGDAVVQDEDEEQDAEALHLLLFLVRPVDQFLVAFFVLLIHAN